jgi:hypothetical protein
MPEYIKQTSTAADNLDIVGFVALAPQDISVLVPAGKLDQAAADKYFQDLQKMFLEPKKITFRIELKIKD